MSSDQWPAMRAGAAVLALGSPAVAAAHGHEAVFFPVGIGVSLFVVLLSTICLGVSWRAGVLAIVLAIVAGMAPVFIFTAYRYPPWVPNTALWAFLWGFVPSVVLSGALLFWRWRVSR